MKIGYFGTPEIAAYCLEKLMSSHAVSFAVTGEDKPAGRNMRLQSSPVKKLAIENGIPVLQPKSIKDDAFFDEIKKFGADIFVIVAYGKIIPDRVLYLPENKTINLHPSLLPKYRGAAPIQWALVGGEKETGVTIQFVNNKLDSGDILLQRRIPVDIEMTAEDLYRVVLPAGSDLLLESLELISSGQAAPVKQDESAATYCGKIDRDTAAVDWGKTSLDIHNLVRGFNPRPCAWTVFRGKNIKVLRTSLSGDRPGVPPAPGRIIKHQKGRLFAGTGDGCIEILTIQPETKKPMDGLSFLNGYRIEEGESFGI
ncbi:MAG: methionyl-tRNA formyltransferase [Spirochaetes bacterium]|nr:methionyl-tRNA formyltransferase [Spirochaetota bacterium]